MKRVTVSLAVAMLALGLVASIASATHSNGEGPDKDFTNGSTKGTTATPLGTFPSQGHVNAHTDPGSSSCTNNDCGNFSLRLTIPPSASNPAGEVQATGRVTCLNAYDGDNSVYGAVIETHTGYFGPYPDGALVGFRILARNTDNGEGKNDPPDASGGQLLGPGPELTVCPAIPFATIPQAQGNITVHDGI